jgi:hypothetical protein
VYAAPLRSLRLHGLIKKVGKTYKYYLTQFGQQVLLAALKVRELVVIAYSTRTRSLIPILFDHRFRLYLITDSTLI